MNTAYCALCNTRIMITSAGWIHEDTGLAYDQRPSPTMGGGMLVGHYAEPPRQLPRKRQEERHA